MGALYCIKSMQSLASYIHIKYQLKVKTHLLPLSKLSPSRMSKLLTLALQVDPDTLQHKLISTTCIHDLVLSVTTHSLWPLVRVGT